MPRRTAPIVARLCEEGLEEHIRQTTGLAPDAYFSGSKLSWLLDHLDLHDRAERGEICFGTVDSFLAWNLVSGRPHVTDATNASRTMLFDIHKNEWDDTLLKALNIPRAILPRVVDTSGRDRYARSVYSRPGDSRCGALRRSAQRAVWAGLF